MGQYSEIKKARDDSKAIKRDHLYKFAVESIKNGTYKFTYGYNSPEALQEIKEVIVEMNNDLKEDGIVLKISSTFYTKVTVTFKNDPIGTFDNTLNIEVDAL